MAGTGALIVKIAKQTQSVEDRTKLSALNTLLIGVLSDSTACKNTFNGEANILEGIAGEFTALKDRDNNVVLNFADSSEKTRLRKLYGLQNPKLRLKCLSATRDACKCQGTSPTPILPCEKQWTLDLTRGGGHSPYETGLRFLVSYSEEDRDKLECNVERSQQTGGPYVYALHSQKSTPPDCPAGWTSLWTGYSYLGHSAVGLLNLAETSSCLETLQRVNYIRCHRGDHRRCGLEENYGASRNPRFLPGTADDGTIVWLIAHSNNPPYYHYRSRSRNPPTSRCRVCEGSKKLIVRHSYTTSVPNVPSGNWEKVWEGYSYTNEIIRMSEIGSCLRYFVPKPHKVCNGAYRSYNNYCTTHMFEPVLPAYWIFPVHARQARHNFPARCAVFMPKD